MTPKRPQAGDDDGGGGWISRALQSHERALVAYATRLLHGDVERARDVVQEAFLRLCRARRADVEPHLREWLFTVCRNRALDLKRQERPMKTIHEATSQGGAEFTGGAPPSAGLEAQELKGQVAELLAGLPDKQGEALRLRFQHGLSYQEIAGVMGESKGSVGWWIHEGLAALRQKTKNTEGNLA